MFKKSLLIVILFLASFNVFAAELVLAKGEQSINYFVTEKLFIKTATIKGILSKNSGLTSELGYSDEVGFTDLIGQITIEKPDFKSRKLKRNGKEIPPGSIDAARDAEVRNLFKKPVVIELDGLDEDFDINSDNNKLTVLLTINGISHKAKASHVLIQKNSDANDSLQFLVQGEVPISRALYKLNFTGLSSMMNNRVGKIITMKFKLYYSVK